MTAKTMYTAIYDGLADWEVGLATASVGSGEWQRDTGRVAVATVGATLDPVTTMGGLRVVPDVVLDDLDPTATAMLVLPGATSWVEGRNGEFAAKAGELLALDVPVAAICGATVGLAVAGVLDDRAHTSNAAEILAATGYGGAHLYVDEPAVTDRGLVTASATAPVEFAREVLALLDLYEPPVLDAWYKLYGEQDPAGYFELVASAAT